MKNQIASCYPVLRYMRSLCWGLLLLLWACQAGATVYHLTTAAQLQSTFWNLSAGDTVYIAAGDYYPAVAVSPYNNLDISNKSGTTSSWITIKNEPGARPRLFLGGSGIYNGLNIGSSSYIRVEGLELVGNSNDTGTFGICVAGTSHHIQLVNNIIHNFGGNGIGGSASQYLIEGNTCYDNCKRAHWGPSGISVYEPQMQSSVNSDFAGTLGNPNDTYSIIIRNNICYNNMEVYDNPQSNSITDGNGIICDDFQHTQNPGSAFSGQTLICNNICYANGGRGVTLYLSDSVDVVNNTVFGNLINLAGEGEIGNEGNSNRLFNNIVWPTSGRAGSVDYGTGAQWQHNLYYNTTTYVAGTSDIVGQNPLFVNYSTDPAQADLHLQAGSPAIGNGTTSISIPKDIAGTARTARNDIGAYQYPGTIVAAPIMTKAPGTYPSKVTVTLTTSTAKASIRYTTNGATPTSTSGTVYTGSITIKATTTLKAIAYTSTASSVVTTGTYTILPYQINSGGAAVSPFNADGYYTGGTVTTTTNVVSTSGVTNAAPAAVYQSERWGAQTYTFTGLTPGTVYTVRLHFAETWFGSKNSGGGGVGSRIFHVNLNGSRVLTNFDILAAAGAANKANVQSFTVAANANGQIIIDYLSGSANYPKSNGIEILP